MNAFGIDISRSGVYQITNAVNGDRYIGSAVNIKRRWQNHKSMLRHDWHYNKHLQNAWNKYGEALFLFDLLLLCEESETLRYEQMLIDKLNPEFNKAISVTAPFLGHKHSDHAKSRIGNAHKGNQYTLGHKLSEEHKRKISESEKGRIFTDETKKKISEAKKNNYHPLRGKHLSPDHSEKVRAGLKRYWAEQRGEL